MVVCAECNSDKHLINNGGGRKYCKSCRTTKMLDLDNDLLSENVNLAKRVQKGQDNNRVKNKAFREHARLENAIEEYSKNILHVFSTKKFSKAKMFSAPKGNKTGIIHISDVHGNEDVDLAHNQYNINIFSKRIRLHIQKAIALFRASGITDILIAFTGDLMNSDRRLDELMTNALNRSEATFAIVDVFQQAIIEVADSFNNVTVASVVGNEGRVNSEQAWSDSVVTDSYDYTINRILKELLKERENVTFIIGKSELVLNINEQNILLLHGHGAIKGNIEKSVQDIFGRYAARGIILRYALFGHIHMAFVSDCFSRSGSTVGANGYSEHALGVMGRASQNLHVVYENGNIDSTKIDLQNVDDITGYTVENDFNAYNSKSDSKIKKPHVIFQVMV